MALCSQNECQAFQGTGASGCIASKLYADAKADFELACLAVSAINGCEACVRAHEAAVLAAGLTEEHVHDAVRIAATVQAAAVSLEMAQMASPEPVAAPPPDALHPVERLTV